MDKTALQIERRIRPRVRYRTGAAKRDRQDFSIDAQRSNRRAFREYIQKQPDIWPSRAATMISCRPCRTHHGIPVPGVSGPCPPRYQRIAVYMTICLREPVILGRPACTEAARAIRLLWSACRMMASCNTQCRRMKSDWPECLCESRHSNNLHIPFSRDVPTAFYRSEFRKRPL